MRTCFSTNLSAVFIAAALIAACGDDPQPAPDNNGAFPDVPDVKSELEKDGKWWIESERLYVTLPAMGAGGDIYFGGWDGKIYAVDADGNQKWSVQTGAKIDAAPAVGADGTVVAGSWDHKVYALTDDGSEKWTYEAGGLVDLSPSIDADGRVYVASDDGTLVRLTDDGSVDWKVDLEAAPVTAPAIFEDEAGLTVFVGTVDETVHCISGDAGETTTAAVAGHPIDDVALDKNGAAYVGTSSGRVFKIERDCTVSFETGLTYAPTTAPTLDADGFIYVGAQNEQIFRLSPEDGSQVWAKPTGRRAPVLAAPTLSDDGKFYAGANGLISIATDGTIEHLSNVDVLTSPLLTQAGGVYTTTESGHLVRLDFDLGGIGDSDWPIQHGNAQRTGYLSP